MAKKTAKKAPKRSAIRARKSTAGTARTKTKSRSAPKKALAVAAPVPSTSGDKLTFNHAMVYSKDVRRSLGFYRDLLGFKLIEDFQHEGISIYARLKAPGGDGTIALHLAGPGTPMSSEGVRLYFEIRDLDDFCRKLQAKGFYITQMPRVMPWGWRHAYLNDPDGHEISLYWAGEMRMQKTVMKAALEVDKAPAAKGR